MNLDLLKTEWQARDKGLEQAVRLNTQMLRLSLLEQHRREISKWGWTDKYEIIAGTPVLIYLIWFLSHYITDLKFALPALTILAWTIAMPLLNHQQRHALQDLDFAQPITSVQRQLAELKAGRLKLFKWAFLLGQIVWFIPFLLVLFKGVFGVDLYQKTENFIIPSLMVSLMFIPLAIGISKLLSGRLSRSASFQALTDSLAGEDYKQTRHFLKTLAQFEEMPAESKTDATSSH
ncbi:hypothetical protein H8L32_17335 [Undibacterium sp. CY18W]|uniref:Uncharacterized protein n=1 Tax=Undibacterium hunanense TaxID=2762292 RepID=A0ABR6ZTN9_9BURK|nr:hypothetical protein [Undibacterium hunanense]MBC3919256.1 hypothetical protein [Undibacterium hunanense]